jgi:hypothetical protein
MIPRQREAKRERQGQDPLTDRNRRQHAIHQVRRRFRHAPPPARRAEPTALAREGNEPIVAASRIVHAQEPVRRDAALQEAPHLALHEPWDATALACARQERLQVLPHRAVQRRPLDAARQRQVGA